MKKTKLIIPLLLILLMTGCTTYLKSDDGKNITNPTTGQNLTENILCQPTDKETIDIYTENGIDISKLPRCACEGEIYTESVYTNDVYTDVTYTCNSFDVTSGGYEGLWTSLFIKPLAWVILFFGRLCNSFGLGLIITSILIRLICFPLTRKTTMQTVQMKKIQPELNRLEQKYASKNKNDKDVMMMKSQEMMAIYKKYNVSPLSGCLFSFLQIPIFIAFLEAINRVPAIFEEKFLLWHLGTSPYIGIIGGNYFYLIIILLVAVSTYFSFNNSNTNVGDDATTKQTKSMMNVFLIMIVGMSIFMSTALGIYWIVSNLWTLGQNYIVKRSMKDEKI